MPGQTANRAYVPAPPIVPQPRMSSVTKLTLSLCAVAAAAGAYWFLGWVPAKVYWDLDRALGKLTCAMSANTRTNVQFVMSARQVDILVPDTAAPLKGCLERGLADMRHPARSAGVIVAMVANVEVDGAGQVRLADSPRKLARFKAQWKPGVLGDSLAAHRGPVADALDGLLADGVECYLEYRARITGHIPELSWFADDVFRVRTQVAPDGSVGAVSTARNVPIPSLEWSQHPGFSECFQTVVKSVAWPPHEGERPEWLNTTFVVSTSKVDER